MAHYSITISPKYRLESPSKLHYDDFYIINRWANKFSKHYIFYSEFDNASRLHYHGIIQIDDLTKFHKTKYRIDKSVGFVKIDKLKTFMDKLKWLYYCKKDQTPESIPPVIYKSLKRRKKPCKPFNPDNEENPFENYFTFI